MFSDLWSKEETPKHSNEKRKLQKPCYQTLRSNKDTCCILKKSDTTKCFNFKKYLTESLQQWAF
ncbi:hypothetical protein HMPREF9184_00326, partial [Streptococcus sp. oral taxon 058 str. F0407]|uniref:hypothetical protein n=1 Tax=Streptococcus sp. oral taxon 058 TaxID=712622 RepID=UPI000234A229